MNFDAGGSRSMFGAVHVAAVVVLELALGWTPKMAETIPDNVRGRQLPGPTDRKHRQIRRELRAIRIAGERFGPVNPGIAHLHLSGPHGEGIDENGGRRIRRASLT